MIAKGLPLNEKVSEYIRYHHEEWNGRGAYGIKGNEIPIASQIIHIADSFDLNFSSMAKDISNKKNINEWFCKERGKLFGPEVTDGLLRLMGRDRFWFDLRITNIQQVLDTFRLEDMAVINMEGLKKIANAFSIIIDSKSNFTHEHSKGIAKITKKLSSYMGYDSYTVEKLQIAAYLHDLGKLVVPNNILEKPGGLSSNEFEIIKSHPYYTKLILGQVKGLEEIAQWAGNHHEKLNGQGYPEGLDYSNLTREDQIVAVADIYQALTESRPYRKGMAIEKALQIIGTMVEKGYISYEVYNNLKQVV